MAIRQYRPVTAGTRFRSVSGFDETFGVLIRGPFLGMKHAAPVMKRQGSGSIISTASVAGLRTGLHAVGDGTWRKWHPGLSSASWLGSASGADAGG